MSYKVIKIIMYRKGSVAVGAMISVFCDCILFWAYPIKWAKKFIHNILNFIIPRHHLEILLQLKL